MTTPDEHRHLFVGRLRREVSGIEGMPPAITLELVRDTDVMEVHEGDEFVTLLLTHDPFEVAP